MTIQGRNLIASQWHPLSTSAGSPALVSRSPHDASNIVWQGSEMHDAVDAAVRAARSAQRSWAALSMDARVAVLRTFAKLAKQAEPKLALLLRDEVGKVSWDAVAEAQLLAAKVDVTLDQSSTGSLKRVSSFDVAINATRTGRCDFRPHGVMAVVGPFNFPLHLPNGHIVPALLMGNTIVFKPSDKAPACGEALVELFDAALREHNAPQGVINLVQGGAAVAKQLVSHADIDGVLFTGSWPVGRAILQANLDYPGRILALEMGGNNAAVVMPDAHMHQAVIECVRSAFVGSGQRCTCTRRIIVHRAIADTFIPLFCKATSSIIVGDPRAIHPIFMGPVINEAARDAVLAAQRRFAASGAEVLVPATAIAWETACENLVSPGVLRVESFHATDAEPFAGSDVEVFGPLVRICVVDSLEQAIEQTNATRFGLAASIFTQDAASQQQFLSRIRAGCININTGTAGASSKLPFGGLGLSGNHRPAGAFSLDYCAYPVGSMIETGEGATVPIGMGWKG
jgi:succinylglutamic semialdehyde dehydrogenase